MTFEQVFKNIITDYEGTDFLTYYDNGRRIVMTKEDYTAKTDAVAARMETLLKDIPKGAWVGIKSANHPFWYALFFGLEKIGYKLVLLDNNCSHDSVKAFIAQSHMKALIADRDDSFEGVLTVPYAEVIAAESGAPQNVCWESEYCFCTSGTTGDAKMYVFNADTVDYQSINVGGHFVNDPDMLESRGDRTIAESPYLITQPFRHCLGFGLPLAFWRYNFPLVMPEKAGVFGIAEACMNDKIWLFISVPAVWKALLQMAKSRYGDYSSESVRKVVGNTLTASASAGARLDETSAERLRALDIRIMNGWGMTETGFVTVDCIKNDPALDYVGAYYNKHHALIKGEDGTIKDGGYGELLINGKAMYNGLLKDGKVIYRDPEEYFATGDIFELHGDRFYFKGRCKSVIINDDGENIYPEELDAYFAFLGDEVNQFCTAEYNKKPALYISVKDYETFDQTEVFKQIVDANLKLPMGKRIAKIIATSLRYPVTSKAETARFFIKGFVAENAESVKEFNLVK